MQLEKDEWNARNVPLLLADEIANVEQREVRKSEIKGQMLELLKEASSLGHVPTELYQQLEDALYKLFKH